jgi:UDP:flavonoid glycosyltransferase YjiC (YdhE family)
MRQSGIMRHRVAGRRLYMATQTNTSIAVFITPHGLGHAARAAAVIEAIHARVPHTRFDLYTSVPPWFFEKSLSAPFVYHEQTVDIGLVQKSPLIADHARTRRELQQRIPFAPALIEGLAAHLSDNHCELVLSDIAALGITAAAAAGIPSVLIENFTWDWIYAGIDDLADGLAPVIEYLEKTYAAADYHIQTEPVCRRAAVDLVTGPVSRKPRRSAAVIREMLGVPADQKLVLVTMGGVAQDYRFLDPKRVPEGVHLVVSGGSRSFQNGPRTTWLPMSTAFYHPDLINACDAVIGKAGYSTLAEAYNAGVPFGYVARSGFRESDILADFIESRMHSLPLSAEDFFDGNWFDHLARLTRLPRVPRRPANGSGPIADFVAALIDPGLVGLE